MSKNGKDREKIRQLEERVLALEAAIFAKLDTCEFCEEFATHRVDLHHNPNNHLSYASLPWCGIEECRAEIMKKYGPHVTNKVHETASLVYAFKNQNPSGLRVRLELSNKELNAAIEVIPGDDEWVPTVGWGDIKRRLGYVSAIIDAILKR